MQAIDRLHRIGQNKPVQVFYMIAPNTVEENILRVSHSDNDVFDLNQH